MITRWKAWRRWKRMTRPVNLTPEQIAKLAGLIPVKENES